MGKMSQTGAHWLLWGEVAVGQATLAHLPGLEISCGSVDWPSKPWDPAERP